MGAGESRPNPSPPDSDGIVTTTYNVGMTCSGCSGAVTRILSKVDGVEDVDADVDKKTVVVKSRGDTKDVCMEKLMKWKENSGKSVEFKDTQ
ncbi:hypothetical protein TrRE_jg11789 [Triparma retinervis]|uniref:HMA domain-containing protein n=1 Tax=Triparma retinervis TaxID=2557542 RepID=A0A9W7AL42_9STRA|nr:hypothetical protein TrRE_jg11789 [Triparma retinervis]